jgi:hypothetical protein
MRGFIKQYADGAFDPAVISILEDAFDDAWRRVQASKAPSPKNTRRMVAAESDQTFYRRSRGS